MFKKTSIQVASELAGIFSKTYKKVKIYDGDPNAIELRVSSLQKLIISPLGVSFSPYTMIYTKRFVYSYLTHIQIVKS